MQIYHVISRNSFANHVSYIDENENTCNLLDCDDASRVSSFSMKVFLFPYHAIFRSIRAKIAESMKMFPNSYVLMLFLLHIFSARCIPSSDTRSHSSNMRTTYVFLAAVIFCGLALSVAQEAAGDKECEGM